MSYFHDEVPLTELLEAGKAKFTPVISLGRLLQLHRYAKENGCIVAYFEAFEVQNGKHYTNSDLNMNPFPETIQNAEDLISFADSEMAALPALVSAQDHLCGFEAYIESSTVD